MRIFWMGASFLLGHLPRGPAVGIRAAVRGLLWPAAALERMLSGARCPGPNPFSPGQRRAASSRLSQASRRRSYGERLECARRWFQARLVLETERAATASAP